MPLFGQPVGDLGDHFGTMLLPAIALAAGLIAIYMRLLRSDMIATLQENFITMAQAKGLSNRRILWRHALRPSSLTLLTVAGLNFGTLIGGAVVVEVIFGDPRDGHADLPRDQRARSTWSCRATSRHRDRLRALNFVVDFLYIVLDPRIRRARATPPPKPTLHDALERIVERRRRPRHAGRRRILDFAAVEAGPETRRRGQGLGVGAWLSIGWMVFVVGGAILAPVPPARRPEGADHRHRPARPVRRRRAPRPATCSAATATAATCSRACSGAGARRWSSRPARCSSASSLGGILGLLGGYFRGQGRHRRVSSLFDVFLSSPR